MYEHKNGLKFRCAELTDIDFLHELKEESWWGTHGTLWQNKAAQRSWLENIPNTSVCLVGFFQPEFPIGVCLISEINHLFGTARISGTVHNDFRTKQIPKIAFSAGVDFAFEMLNLRRLDAEVLEYHYPAQKLEVQYLGFVKEGRRREAVYKCGRYYDSIILGLLRKEWEVQDRVVKLRGRSGTCNLAFDHRFALKMSIRATNHI